MKNDFLIKVQEIMEEVYPEHYNESLILEEKVYIEKIETAFKKAEEIYNEKEKYKLHWAYKNAQKIFNEVFIDMIENHIKIKLKKYKDKNEESQLLKFNKINLKLQKRIKRKFEFFSIASSFVFLVDILISMILILTISKISHNGEMQITSATIGTMFVIFMALSKITIDKFLISPKLEKFGWNMYNKSLIKYKKALTILIAVLISIEDAISKNMDKQEIKIILKKGILIKSTKR